MITIHFVVRLHVVLLVLRWWLTASVIVTPLACLFFHEAKRLNGENW